MTDRRVGGDGLQTDVVPIPNRQVGAAGLSLDVVASRGLAGIGLTVDVLLTGVGIAVRRPGGMGLVVDVAPLVQRRQGSVGLMVDYIAGLVTAGIGWGSGAFQAIGGPEPDVYWGTGAFALTDGVVVTWDGEAFVPA